MAAGGDHLLRQLLDEHAAGQHSVSKSVIDCCHAPLSTRLDGYKTPRLVAMPLPMPQAICHTRSQLDRHPMTAAHWEPGLGCACPSVRAAARTPPRQLDTRHTPISTGEATAEVWMLLSNRMSVRVRLGRKGMLGMGKARTAARDRVPAARGVSWHFVLEGGCRNGRIRLGDVQRVSMVAD